MRFSLIVATLGRVEELKALCDSLASQTHQDFEVIIVDQNADDRLAWTGEPGLYPFPITRLRSRQCHSSQARNTGLQSASGDIVAFPDDDCTYPSELLAKVDQAFRDQPGLGVRTGPSANPEGRLGSGRWQQQSGAISIENAWNTVIEFNIFIRRGVAMAIGGFDEQLGVGGTFGSAEGNDLVLRALRTGCHGWYDISQIAVHPDKKFVVRRAFTYGAGLGYALRKHGVPARVWLNLMVRPLGGCVLNLVGGRVLQANYHWHTLRGRAYGFRAYPKAAGIRSAA